MSKNDYTAEDMEVSSGYFQSQAQSEYKQIVEREKRRTRTGRVMALRKMGRGGRRELAKERGVKWQELI